VIDMEKEMSSAEANENMENQEVKYVEMAEDFFKQALSETKQNAQAAKRSAKSFGQGLGCLLFLYMKRAWYLHWNPLKSFITGVRPMAHAIDNFMRMDPKDTEAAGIAYKEMIDTLFLTIFREHSIKAFKSVLETSNLKKILIGITQGTNEFEDELNKKIGMLKKNKLKEKFYSQMANDICDELDEKLSSTPWFGIFISGFFTCTLAWWCGYGALLAYSVLGLTLAGVINLIHIIVYNVLPVYARIKGTRKTFKTDINRLKDKLNASCDDLEKGVPEFYKSLQNGIKSQLSNMEQKYRNKN